MKTFQSKLGMLDPDGEHYLLDGKEWIEALTETVIIPPAGSAKFLSKVEFLTQDPCVVSFHNASGSDALTRVGTILFKDNNFSGEYYSDLDTISVLPNRAWFLYFPLGQASVGAGTDRTSVNPLLGKYLQFSAYSTVGTVGATVTLKLWTTRRNIRLH